MHLYHYLVLHIYIQMFDRLLVSVQPEPSGQNLTN